MTKRFLHRVPWSGAFAIGLAVVGSFPAFSGPFPALSIETLAGKSLYILTLVVLGTASIIAQTHENDGRQQQESARDIETEKRHSDAMTMSASRHTEDMAANSRLELSLADARRELDKLSATVQSMAAAMNRSSSPTSSEMTNLVESARTSVATIHRHLDFRPKNIFVYGHTPPTLEGPLFEMPKMPSSGKPPT